MPPTPVHAQSAAFSRVSTLATPHRIEMFRDLWINPALSVKQVMHHLNAYPGPTINNPQSLYNWARRLGLPTTRTDLPALPVAAAQVPAPPPEDQVVAAETLSRPDNSEPGVQVDAQGLAPVAQSRAPLSARSIWDEAADLLDAGMSVVDVARDLDLPKGKVSDLKFKLLAEREAKREAR